MPITQHGPYCDVCAKIILPLGDEMVNHFDAFGLENLIADNACTATVKEVYAKKDWKILPLGPLRKVWEEQEAKDRSGKED